MVRMPCLWRCSRMAMARAAPSVGSVPAPSSSKSTRLSGVICFKKDTMFVMWEEKVLRLCSMLCSSPMSANTLVNTPSSERSRAGMWRPAWPIRVKSPTVFRETVFPPVLGPVMMSRSKSSPSVREMGTTDFGSRRGWRPWRIRILRSLLKRGRLAFMERARAPRAKMKSSSVMAL